jgi:hypothetical protein
MDLGLPPISHVPPPFVPLTAVGLQKRIWQTCEGNIELEPGNSSSPITVLKYSTDSKAYDQIGLSGF